MTITRSLFATPISILSLCALATACAVGPGDGGAAFVSAGDLGDAGDSSGEDDDEEPAATTGDDADATTGDATTGDDTTTTGDDASTGAGDSTPEQCEVLSFAAPEVTPEIMLVIDRSSSMVHTLHESYFGPDSEAEETTRWAELHELLGELVPSLDARARFGAQLFPSAQGDPDVAGSECEVGVAPALALDGEAPADPLKALYSVIPSANAGGFYGATPIRAAVTAAADHLIATGTGEPQAIVLLTDGAANCAEGSEKTFEQHDGAVPALLTTLHEEHGIPTFVVGIQVELDGYLIPAVNPYAALNKLGLAGGRPMGVDQAYFEPEDVDALRSELRDLARARQCVFSPELGGAYTPDALGVYLDGEALARVDACDDASGWRAVTDDEGALSSMELCGDACDRFADGDSLDVALMCE
ncbi:MAG: hypothetical protein H6713_07840 [Myxococcales bacterium]|nr:hypothetical protein [Myxococcales bacterium]